MRHINTIRGLVVAVALAACGGPVPDNSREVKASDGVTQMAEPMVVSTAPATAETDGDVEADRTLIVIRVGSQTFQVTLNESEAAKTLLSSMPLTLNMSELNGNEKYYYLREPLPMAAESVGTIKNGDLMLYGSDCLVLFYEDFSTSYRYTRLGAVTDPSGLREALGSGSVEVSFEWEPN